MIEICKEDLLKNSIDYEDYSENICRLNLEELIEEGLLKCNGCCLRHKNRCDNAQSNK